jgi:hypothetical protein
VRPPCCSRSWPEACPRRQSGRRGVSTECQPALTAHARRARSDSGNECGPAIRRSRTRFSERGHPASCLLFSLNLVFPRSRGPESMRRDRCPASRPSQRSVQPAPQRRGHAADESNPGLQAAGQLPVSQAGAAPQSGLDATSRNRCPLVMTGQALASSFRARRRPRCLSRLYPGIDQLTAFR